MAWSHKLISFCIMWIFFFWAEFMFWLTKGDIEKFTRERYEFEKTPLEAHWTGMIFSAIYLTGNAMLIFRLLAGYKTRILKFFHGGLHVFCVFSGSHAYYNMQNVMKEQKVYVPAPSLHRALGKFYMECYLIQCITGFTIFVYMYPNQRLRRMYAVLHNCFGICLYMYGVVTVLDQIYWQDSARNEKDTTYAQMMLYMLLGYAFVVIGIVICPFFEWKPVGPI